MYQEFSLKMVKIAIIIFKSLLNIMQNSKVFWGDCISWSNSSLSIFFDRHQSSIDSLTGLCECPKPTDNFTCYDKFGKPVSSDSIPTWSHSIVILFCSKKLDRSAKDLSIYKNDLAFGQLIWHFFIGIYSFRGLCERTDCGYGKYPDPMSVLCDGNTKKWTPSLDTVACVGNNLSSNLANIRNRQTSLYAVFLSTILHIFKWELPFFLEPIIQFKDFLGLFMYNYTIYEPNF